MSWATTMPGAFGAWRTTKEQVAAWDAAHKAALLRAAELASRQLSFTFEAFLPDCPECEDEFTVEHGACGGMGCGACDGGRVACRCDAEDDGAFDQEDDDDA